jgi:hypothetical protein
MVPEWTTTNARERLGSSALRIVANVSKVDTAVKVMLKPFCLAIQKEVGAFESVQYDSPAAEQKSQTLSFRRRGASVLDLIRDKVLPFAAAAQRDLATGFSSQSIRKKAHSTLCVSRQLMALIFEAEFEGTRNLHAGVHHYISGFDLGCNKVHDHNFVTY